MAQTQSSNPAADDQPGSIRHYRLLDLNVPGTMPISKLSLLPNHSIVVTTSLGYMALESPPHGRWRAPHPTSLETFSEYRNTRDTRMWIRLDSTNCYQRENTPEMLLIPWCDEYKQGPTVQSVAFALAECTTNQLLVVSIDTFRLKQ